MTNKEEKERQEERQRLEKELKTQILPLPGERPNVYDARIKRLAEERRRQDIIEQAKPGLSKAGQKGGARRREQGDSPMRDRKGLS